MAAARHVFAALLLLCALASAGCGTSWSVAADFLAYPLQGNPILDLNCACAPVWYFQQVDATREPQLAGAFTLSLAGFSELQAWQGSYWNTELESMPYFAKNVANDTLAWQKYATFIAY